MLETKQLVIIGGGSSIQEGISKDLWSKLENKFVIGLNYSYKYFSNPTVQCFVDHEFYSKEYDDLKSLGLIIGKSQKTLKLHDNTITMTCSGQYNRDVRKAVYKASLVGIFALSLGIYLLDEGEIFLLGYDFGELTTEKDAKNRVITHFYQGQTEHRGIGKNSYYNISNKANDDFKVYSKETRCKIYNVSMKSKIDIFDKISYDEFFTKLDKNIINNEEIRKDIRNKLTL